jgi:hypothetical protein
VTSPVLPPVNSTTRMPGLSVPRASAPSIIAKRHTVLVGTGRVVELEFDEHVGRARRNHSSKPDDGCPADGAKHRLLNHWSPVRTKAQRGFVHVRALPEPSVNLHLADHSAARRLVFGRAGEECRDCQSPQ